MGIVWTLGPLGAVVAIVVACGARGSTFEDEGDRDFERIRTERRARLAKRLRGRDAIDVR
jgi:hypothetical protein